MTGARQSRRGERGSATLQVLGMVMVLLTAVVGASAFAGLAAAKHRATSAADLAALAAARGSPGSPGRTGRPPWWWGSPDRVTEPTGDCDAARTTAAANGARLTSCVHEGTDVTVTVAVVAEAPLGIRHTLTARARAGPAR